jgi:UDP-N-acetylglucosamine 2-epimerase
MIPIFTNVVFDTSQSHSNTLFEDMFDWLEALAGVIISRPETLFVIRAHPDEDRPGKASRESVADWFRRSPLNGRENVVFIEPSEYISSYELIDRAKCVLVYSSSVGLEASVLGVPVLCAGRARYTQAQTVVFPASRQAYVDQLDRFVAAERLEVSQQTRRNAKAFLYHELYNASLDLAEFLLPYRSMPGMVVFSDFDPRSLEDHPTLSVIRDGVLEGSPFLLPAGSARMPARAEAVR